jgi:predicted RNase H-like HicB family nuclease
MRQLFHSIIKHRSDGSYVGWVEEIPGTITRGMSIDECRERLREALELILETNRSEARLWMDASCVEEFVEVDAPDHLAVPNGV